MFTTRPCHWYVVLSSTLIDKLVLLVIAVVDLSAVAVHSTTYIACQHIVFQGRLIEYQSVCLGLRQGVFTCLGWQVTLWQVASGTS